MMFLRNFALNWSKEVDSKTLGGGRLEGCFTVCSLFVFEHE